MAPACILLDRIVAFRRHPQESEPFGIPGMTGAERAKELGCGTAEGEEIPSREDMEASIVRYLLAMTPDLGKVVEAEAPEVGRLTLQRPLSSDTIQGHGWFMPDGAVAAAAHKNLVVLNPGSHRSVYSYNRWCLLLDLDADASLSSSLSAIPAVLYEYTESYRTTGHGTVIMTRDGGTFVLADLLFGITRRGLPTVGMLCLWQSSLCKWVYKQGRLPAEVVPHKWRTHMSFPVQSKNRNLFCWVDLLHGLLLCDLGPDCEVDLLNFSSKVSFVPLPHGCSIRDGNPRWSRPDEFRNLACVDGTIKFLTIDGFVKRSQILLITYALDLDKPSPRWMIDTKLFLEDLWEDKMFISNHVPRIMPLFPVLSTLEHDVVYLVIPGDLERKEGYRFTGAKLLLSVDTRKARVISATQQKHPRELARWLYLLAFSASHSQSQWGSKYHKGVVEAIGMGASAKRMKLE